MVRLDTRVLLCLAVLVGPNGLEAQEPGDQVAVTAVGEIPMQLRDISVVQVPRGAIVTVRSVSDESFVIRWDGKTGTISRQHVLSLAKAEEHFTREILLAPTPANYVACGNVRYENQEDENALADFELALKLDPRSEWGFIGRAGVRLWLAVADGKVDEKLMRQALADYARVLKLNPKSIYAYLGRAFAWSALNKLDEAIAEFDKALKVDPDFAEVIAERGAMLAYYGQYEKALADYNKAIRLDPDDQFTYCDLGWLLAACPDEKLRSGKQAVQHATKACQLSNWKDDLCVSTLAAAHAEAGDFDAAIKWQLQAIELAPDEAKEAYRFCLDHMKKGEPCRDMPLETEASGNPD
jgi:tetratricopeptide (TPR) repeat protein